MEQSKAWMTRSRRRTMLGDLILALTFLLFALMLGASTDTSNGQALLFAVPKVVSHCYILVSAIPIVFRRTRPETAAWVYVALTVCQILLGPSLWYNDMIAPVMLYSVLVYGRSDHGTRFVVTSIVLGVLLSTTLAWTTYIDPLFSSGDVVAGLHSWRDIDSDVMRHMLNLGGTSLLFIGICIATTVVAAIWQRARMITVRAMRERNASIAARTEEEQRVAAAAERARIARDMHDVVAHTLSTIIIQSDGGRYAGANDIVTARGTMTTIRQEASRAKHDMTRLFDIFSGAHETGYENIGVLIREAQVPVTNEAHPERLSSKANEALYRLVQESLSNVRKYAGPGAKVDIHEIWSDDALFISITDDGQGAKASEDGHAPGYGLIGMKERIAAVDGEVEAGPQPNGGFSVEATLPLQGGSRPVDHEDTNPPLVAEIRKLADLVRPKPLFPARSADDGWISKLSHWAERHYLLVDMIVALLLILYFPRTFDGLGVTYSPFCDAFFTLLLVPLAFRRRFPESSALVVAVLSLFQLLFLPSLSIVNVLSLVSVYSAVLYGRDRAWRWVSVALVVDAWLAGVKTMGQRAYRTPLLAIIFDSSRAEWDTFVSGIIPGAMIVIAGAGCIMLARWTRSLGANALVLQQREEALRAEEEQQKILAANVERGRIAAAIQTEVSTTLDTVIEQADKGLRMLDVRDGEDQPTPQQIAEAFKAIGDQGRKALAHMRQLLTVLRETGFSDDAHANHAPEMQLRPAASLDEQLRSNHLAANADGHTDGRTGNRLGDVPGAADPHLR
ncbi:histidine kinase [Bifidobacterium sp. 64T4]|nr:histidine kinase [Bifidobacterium pongonis]